MRHVHLPIDGLSHRVKVEYGTVTLDQDDDFSSFGDVDTTKEYVFDGTQPIIEYDNDGGTRTVTKQYYWGMGLPGGIGGLLYMKVPGSPDAYYYYHYDGGGNVTCVTDADKDIMALYEYDAFGNVITKCGSLANDFLFSTQLSNSNAGWYMYMFRNYDPMLGRWTQRDPLGGMNLYQYCRNNPVGRIDVLGLKADTDNFHLQLMNNLIAQGYYQSSLDPAFTHDMRAWGNYMRDHWHDPRTIWTDPPDWFQANAFQQLLSEGKLCISIPQQGLRDMCNDINPKLDNPFAGVGWGMLEAALGALAFGTGTLLLFTPGAQNLGIGLMAVGGAATIHGAISVGTTMNETQEWSEGMTKWGLISQTPGAKLGPDGEVIFE